MKTFSHDLIRNIFDEDDFDIILLVWFQCLCFMCYITHASKIWGSITLIAFVHVKIVILVF